MEGAILAYQERWGAWLRCQTWARKGQVSAHLQAPVVIESTLMSDSFSGCSNVRRDAYAAPTAASLVAAAESKASRGPGNGHHRTAGGLRQKTSKPTAASHLAVEQGPALHCMLFLWVHKEVKVLSSGTVSLMFATVSRSLLTAVIDC